jgi:hypothetical protein
MSTLIWLHEDALRADHPVFAAAGDAAHACFIWDDAYMDAMGYGLKRRVFIYETLVELPVDIYAGPIVETVRAVAQKYKATHIVTGKTPNPLLKEMMASVRGAYKVTSIGDAAFVQMDAMPELKRFFKYWNKAKKKAFLYDGRG